jgi:hypothetical protein
LNQKLSAKSITVSSSAFGGIHSTSHTGGKKDKESELVPWNSIQIMKERGVTDEEGRVYQLRQYPFHLQQQNIEEEDHRKLNDFDVVPSGTSAPSNLNNDAERSGI